MLLKGCDPKSRKRTELLKCFSERGLSMNTRRTISEKLRGLTDEQKEERVGQILAIINCCETEAEILEKLSGVQEK